MTKTVLYLFLTLNFVGVQSLASLCKTKCSLKVTEKIEKTQADNEPKSCHSTETSKKKKKSEDECESVCQTDDLIHGDSEIGISSEVISPQTTEVFRPLVLDIENRKISPSIRTHDPPGQGFLHGLAIYSQKSSFLI